MAFHWGKLGWGWGSGFRTHDMYLLYIWDRGGGGGGGGDSKHGFSLIQFTLCSLFFTQGAWDGRYGMWYFYPFSCWGLR